MAHRSIRSLCLGIVAASVLIAAAGCTASGSESGGDDDKLVVWTYYATGGQVVALEKQNELFTAAHPDIEVEHVQIPFDQLASRLLAAASTQDGPDVVFDNVVVDLPALVSGGVLEDLTEYWDGYADKDQFGDASLWAGAEGGLYNISSYVTHLALFYNADILAEYGIDPPETVDELEAAMSVVADAGEYTPLSMSGVPTPEGAWMWMPMIVNEGGGYCNFEGPTVTDGFEKLQNWAESGYVPREAATWVQTDAFQAFMGGDFAFALNGNWNLGEVPKADFEIGTVRYPAGSKGNQVFLAGEAIGIGAFSDKKDLAWEYVESAWLSDEGSLINFVESGQIPTRLSAADAEVISSNTLVQPFVEETIDPVLWPANSESAAMQVAFAKAMSGVISQQFDAQEAAERAITDVAEAREAGGGGC